MRLPCGSNPGNGLLKGSTSFRASRPGIPGLCGFHAGRIQATGFLKGVTHPLGHPDWEYPVYAASVREESRHRLPKGGRTSFRASLRG
ncbi:hypothetical protein Dimus_028454, partial [Dionaea muscipula]